MKTLQEVVVHLPSAALGAGLLAGAASAQTSSVGSMPSATVPAGAIPPKAGRPGLTMPAARGGVLYGRSSGSTLTPVDSPTLPTAAASMPTDKLKVRVGFKIGVFATGIPNARSMVLSDKGTVFVCKRLLDKVYATTQADGKPKIQVLVSGLHRPHGVAFKDGNRYVAELNKIWRFDNIDANLANPPKPTLIYDDLPSDEAHGWKFIGTGSDNKLTCRSARRATS